jgi:DNA-binding transcriptional LysR family regulator
MRAVDIAAVDLNLLVVLEALLFERHVTHAAQRLHMSQPAVSRALARLRTLFDDDLLVRLGQRMYPTPKAEALLPALQQVLGGVRDLVSPSTFDPALARGAVRLAAPDIVAYMLGPPLLRRLKKDAPNLDVEIVQWSASWRDQLVSGEVDLTFGQPAGNEPGIYSRLVIRNEWATVLRRGHPILRERWGLESYLTLSHLLIAYTSHGGGQVDAALGALGRRRRIGLRIPYVILSPMIIAETDLVLTTARWLALKLASRVELVIKEPPVKLAPVDIPMVWHERANRDPKQRWLRSVLAELASEAEMVAGMAAKSAGRRRS